MAIDRFKEKVRFGDECWEWVAGTNARGYGVFRGPHPGGLDRLAHRWIYRMVVGEIPEGINVLHRCDNPPCVRPRHLFLGTHADNAADKAAKGRSVAPNANRAVCPNGHAMTPENTRITYQKQGRYIHRACRECRNAQQRAYASRKA